MTVCDLLAVMTRVEFHETVVILDGHGAEDSGPHALAVRRDVAAGYMFVSADSVERAIEVAKEMPMLMPGSTIEIREVAGP